MLRDFQSQIIKRKKRKTIILPLLTYQYEPSARHYHSHQPDRHDRPINGKGLHAEEKDKGKEKENEKGKGNEKEKGKEKVKEKGKKLFFR